MKILDATCGTKSMWFVKNHPLVTYIDKRSGNFLYWNKSKAEKTVVKINPDIVADWTKRLPFDDDSFDMIVFDPPHIIKNEESENPIKMEVYYSFLPKSKWKSIIKNGVAELFRVLKPQGVFVFKWAETHADIDDIIRLFPYPPIFGNHTKELNKAKNDSVHWLIFLKYDVNKKLEI